jgi:hypothetical protein
VRLRVVAEARHARAFLSQVIEVEVGRGHIDLHVNRGHLESIRGLPVFREVKLGANLLWRGLQPRRVDHGRVPEMLVGIDHFVGASRGF